MKRFKEPLKTLLILLLTASAVFLAWKGNLFSAFFPEIKSAVTASPEPDDQSFTAAALPCSSFTNFALSTTRRPAVPFLRMRSGRKV